MTQIMTGLTRSDTCLGDLLTRCGEGYGSLDALIVEGERMSWAQLVQRARRLARSMAGLGIGPGDSVAVFQPNGPDIVEVAYATALLGAVLVPISPRLAPPEAQFILRDGGCRMAFVDEEHSETAALVCTTIVSGTSEYAQFVESGGVEEEFPPADVSSPAVILYTSGTTGRPKGVLHSQYGLIQNAYSVLISQQINPGDVYLTCTPLTHAAGTTRLYNLLMAAATHAILPRFSAESFVQAVEHFKITHTMLVPTMLSDILDVVSSDISRLASLKTLVYGAAPASNDLVQRATRLLPCGLVHGYGCTEGGAALTALGSVEHHDFAATGDRRVYSIGRPLPGVCVRIVDDEGRVARVGEPGQIMVRSDHSMMGYTSGASDTSAVLKDGWLATGDVGRIDEHGYIFLVGRARDVIISGGLNVYPAEVEEIIKTYPGVEDAAVVGIPHARWGESPYAFVVPSAGTEFRIDDVLSHCRQFIAGYKVPKAGALLDVLPRNDLGKVIKARLRELAEQGSRDDY